MKKLNNDDGKSRIHIGNVQGMIIIDHINQTFCIQDESGMLSDAKRLGFFKIIPEPENSPYKPSFLPCGGNIPPDYLTDKSQSVQLIAAKSKAITLVRQIRIISADEVADITGDAKTPHQTSLLSPPVPTY